MKKIWIVAVLLIVVSLLVLSACFFPGGPGPEHMPGPGHLPMPPHP
jgi:hypothetical protein